MKKTQLIAQGDFFLQDSDSKKTRKEVLSTYNITRIKTRNVNQ